MSGPSALETIRERILCRFPLLFLTTWEEERWEGELASLALDMERGLVIWTATDGAAPALNTEDESHRDPVTFIEMIRSYPRDHIFLLKDFHPFLKDPIAVRLLRDLLPSLGEQHKTILLMGPDDKVPNELRRDTVSLDLPLPRLEEMREELRDVLIQRQHRGEPQLRMSKREQERLLKTVLGLTANQARQSMSRALLGKSRVDDDVYAMLISEKSLMVQGSDLLDFQELQEGASDIGGLDSLKEWISKRGEAFTEKARKRGIPSPKGVLLLGVQGCGKSLTARAVARMLSFPLIRLDVSTLLSADQGQSEKNMRNVLTLTEMIAPAVLWIDEVEKGFSGVDTDRGAGDTTMIRLMGAFLTWMQDKPAPVFVVATANSVTSLPPEMLRRGRFDELFFVDLPNFHERKDIFAIHLKKKLINPDQFDLGRLSDMTEGFSGAEIEQIVLTAMVESFNKGDSLNENELKIAAEDTVPLSVTMEEKIFQLREWARTRCRPATPDSRVLQMLETEQREKTGEEHVSTIDLFESDDVDEEDEETWQSMAEEGQVRAALLQYVSTVGEVTFDQIQTDFTPLVESTGEFGLALRADPHIVIWEGMSADIAAPLARLISDRKLYMHPVTADQYRSAEGQISIPRLPAMPDNRVSRASWLPVTVSVVSPDEVDERLCRVARMKLSRKAEK